MRVLCESREEAMTVGTILGNFWHKKGELRAELRVLAENSVGDQETQPTGRWWVVWS